MTDTKTKILEVAERLLIVHGPDKLTLRMITAEAGVNLAAINYHFGSKADMENALLTRFIGPIEEKRLQMLDKAEKAAGTAALPLETVIRCFLIPLAEFADKYPENRHIFIGLYRLFNDETRFKAQIQRIMEQTLERFSSVLCRALPDVPRETTLVRLTFIWSTSTALLDSWMTEQVKTTLGLDAGKRDILQEMVVFLAAGFRNLGPRALPKTKGLSPSRG